MRRERWKVESGKLSLALFMLRILATDDAAHHFALAAPSDDETAIFADGLGGGTNFHEIKMKREIQ